MFNTSTKCNPTHAGILVVRVVVGALFAYHGIAKLLTMTQTVGYMESMGIPAFLAYLVMIGETVGGLMLVSGFFVRYAAAVLAVIMVGAIWIVKLPNPFEFELVLLGVLVGLMVSGSGDYRIPCMCGTCEACMAKKAVQ